MELALALSALLLGLAGTPHCAAMCGPACAAVQARCGGVGVARPTAWAFHLARGAGYAAVGALVAAGVGTISWLAAALPLLRPFWTLLHAAALVLGIWMVWTGRQPGWLAPSGSRRQTSTTPLVWLQRLCGPAATAERLTTAKSVSLGAVSTGGRSPLVGAGSSGSLPASLAGLSWAAWPCGLLQSALVVAGLSNSAWGGALVMASFSVATVAGLQLVPWFTARTGLGPAGKAAPLTTFAIRGAGLLLALASGWALSRDVWRPVWDYCFG